MKIKAIIIMMALFAGLTLIACEKEGPAEKAGKKSDKTMEKVGETVKETGEEIKETTE